MKCEINRMKEKLGEEKFDEDIQSIKSMDQEKEEEI